MSNSVQFSTAEINRRLARYPRDLQDIILEIRNLVLEAAPQATERILPDGLGWHDAERGGPVKAGICLAAVKREQVRLSFIHGAYLDDSTGLLQIDEGRKAKRYLLIHSFNEAPWDAIEALIREHAHFDPTSIGDL